MKSDQARKAPRATLRASFNKAPFPVTLCMSLAVILAGCSSSTSGNSGAGGGSTQTTAPVLSGLARPASTPPSVSSTLSANGSNFSSGSESEWNGAPLTTSDVSPVLLTEPITGQQFA